MNDQLNLPTKPRVVAHDYLDLESCLAIAQVYNCHVSSHAPQDAFTVLGITLPIHDDDDTDMEEDKGFDILVPLYAIEPLNKYVNFYLPDWLTSFALETYQANPDILCLYLIERYFYTVGLYFANISQREEGEKMIKILIYLYTYRLKKFITFAQNSEENHPQQLTWHEKVLFDKVRTSAKAFNDWWKNAKPGSRRRKYPGE
uniref:DNA replication complex GINS protein PSF3 n=1 Tax=Rhabditophanes sp. KR3021 TaxID=114890 RepID=A0AC35TQL7_9BILA